MQHGDVAQRKEQLPSKQLVGGSSPSVPATTANTLVRGHVSSSSGVTMGQARWRQPLTHPLSVRDDALRLSPPRCVRPRLPRTHLDALNASFRRTPERESKSPRTIQAFTDAVRFLADYCRTHYQPLLADELTRDHVRAFIADQLARCKPTTAHQRYRSLRSFFKWALEEEEISATRWPGCGHRTSLSSRSQRSRAEHRSVS
jgi:hypothetical protein